MKTIEELQKDNNYLVYELDFSYEIVDVHSGEMFMVAKEPDKTKSANFGIHTPDAEPHKDKQDKSANFGIHIPDQPHPTKSEQLLSKEEYEQLPLVQSRQATKDDENGKWITVKGNPVFIPNDKNTGDVIKDHFEKLKGNNKVDKKSYNSGKKDWNLEYKKVESLYDMIGEQISELNNKAIFKSADKIKSELPEDFEKTFGNEFFKTDPYYNNVSESFRQQDRREMTRILRTNSRYGLNLTLKETLNNPDIAAWTRSLFTGTTIIGRKRYDDKRMQGLYRALVKELKNKSPEFKRMSDNLAKRVDKIRQYHEKHRTVWRGTGLRELEHFIETGKIGVVPKGSQRKNLANQKFQFTSCSISPSVAQTFMNDKEGYGIIIEYDTTDLNEGEYATLEYDYEANYKTNSDPPWPHEKFNGKYTALYLNQMEIQLKRKSQPRIKSIHTNGKIEGMDKLIDMIKEKYGWDVEVYENTNKKSSGLIPLRPKDEMGSIWD